MACYTPLSANIYSRGKDGKKTVKVLSKNDGYGNATLPCGRCIGCRLGYSREWANRCSLESRLWKYNYFVTLTYRDDELTYNDLGLPTLVPDHLKKFMKDLRRYYDYHFNHKNIRFFACGEYGDKFKRPHYHLIIFNLPIDDLVLHKTNREGDPLYTSQTLEKIWNKGWVIIGNVNWESSAYVARYVMKKQTGVAGKNYYELNKLSPEFVRMSRSPGIGYDYYKNNKSIIYSNDKIFIPTKKGIQTFKPPRYFDRLYELDNSIDMWRIKDERYEYMQNKMLSVEDYTGMKYEAYVFCEFNKKRKSVLQLKRTLI